MKYLFMLLSGIVVLTSCDPANPDHSAQDQEEVASAVEVLRTNLVDPEESVLDNLMAPKVTYGHSNGLVEDKNTCIGSIVSGKFNFLNMELTNQTIDLSGNTAIVRHDLTGDTHDVGKEPGKARLRVLQVWQKQDGKWLLLARHATRLPE